MLGEFSAGDKFSLYKGAKRYELTNHLGNVLSVVSDELTPNGEAQVISAKDYYPFGMSMPSRSTEGGTYRYGFNGKEKDTETGIQDYGMRWYLPNIARFPSVDPITKEYPELTPYQFASNTPIQAIDLDGLEGGHFFIFSKVWGTELVLKVEHMTGVSSGLLSGMEIKINELRSKIMSEHSGKLSVSSETFVEKLTMYFPHSFANFSNISEGWDVDNTTNIPCDKPSDWLGRGGGQPCNNAHRTQVSALKDKGLIKVSIEVKNSGEITLPKQSLTLSGRSDQSLTSDEFKQRIENFRTAFEAKAIADLEIKLNKKLSEDEKSTIRANIKANIDASINKQTTKNQTQLSSSSNNDNSVWTYKIDAPAKLRFSTVLLVVEHFVGTPQGIQRQPCGPKGDMPRMTMEIGVGCQITDDK
jgi:RHS repeat-associated protein